MDLVQRDTIVKPKSRLSIVLVTKSAHKYLELCLKSLEKNSVYDNELVIVCDQPSWQTLKLLQERNIQYYLTNFNHFFMACNFGAKKASREYVGFINDDVYLGPGWDGAIEEVLHPDILACVTNINPVNGPRFGYGGELRDLSKFDISAFEDYCLKNRSGKVDSFFWMPLVVNKKVFLDFGGFTYYNSQAHGHEIQLENRIKWAGGIVVTSNRSFLFHFGNVGNDDKMSADYRFYYKGFFGCSMCGKIVQNSEYLDSGPVVEFIQINGYWLCDDCVIKAGKPDNNTIRHLRNLHATRTWD